MERLTRFSVDFPTTVWMLILAVLLLGTISFERLGVELFPDLANPRLFVEVDAGDRPPTEVERRYVIPLEAAAARSRGVVDVTAVVRAGSALVTVEYGWDVDMDEAFLDLSKAMADFGQRSDADEIRVSQHDPNGEPVVVAAFLHPEVDDLDALRRTAESIVRTELVRLPGVAAVELVGARRREIEVRTDAYTLQAYGVTLEQLAAAVQAANRNMSGGTIVEMGRRYLIKGVGELTSVAELEALVIARAGGAVAAQGPARGQTPRPVFLRDVATVQAALSEPESLVRFDGQRCLGLEIYREARANTIDAARAVHDRLQSLRAALPGYRIEVVSDQSRFIAAAVTEVGQTGVAGVLLAVVVLFVFLRRLGATAVISLAIPVSVVATFNLMYFGDLSLNLMTLGGLALGAGMLVDNAIVVVENVTRHLEAGSDLRTAAIRGAAEVGGAITSSTLTTIIVFLPIVYLHGAAGELFREQAWTVAFALLSSLAVALLVIPMLCARLLGSAATVRRDAPFPRYGRLLEALLRHRWRIALAATAAVAVTGASVSRLGSEFMPRVDETGELTLQLRLPEGTDLTRTEGAVRNIEALVRQHLGSDLAHLYARVGLQDLADPQQGLGGRHQATVRALFRADAEATPAALIDALGDDLAGLPDVDVEFLLRETALETSLGRAQAPVVVELRGQDLQILTNLAGQVETRLRGVAGLTGVTASLRPGRPAVDVVVDRTAAAGFGLSIDAIGNQLQNLLSGRDAGQLHTGGDPRDIVLRGPDLAADELATLLLDADGGRRVRLDEVAHLVRTETPRQIERGHQTRVVHVDAHLETDEPFDRVAARVAAALADLPLPAEYSWVVAGEEELRQESFRSLRFALLLAVVLVYMVMAAQFESLLHPFVILLTIPLAGVGAVLLLGILGMPLNVMSFIGVILLAGIAVNDSIILVDRINQGRRDGLALEAAIVHAGRTRVRPILMTSATTMLALLPLAVGVGEGAALRGPMAVAVIGGLVTSTALTLVVIPCVYRILAPLDRVRPRPA